jgi:hypothetical protein
LSIQSTTRGEKYEIVVIDGGSFDGCGEMLKQCYPEVRFIQSDMNVGFAKANNEAFKASRGRNILFLNPDTELEDSSIHILLHQLESLPNAGIVGAKLLNSDKTIQTSIQSFPNILNQIIDAKALRQRFPRWNSWGMRPLFEQFISPSEVEVVSGACLMIKRNVFEAVGRFSTDYFMYSEDVDLCFKVHRRGWKTYYIPNAVVVHHGGASSSKSSVKNISDVMMLESRWRFYRKTRSLWYCRKYCLAMFSVSLFRISLLIISWPVFKMLGKAILVDRAFRKWKARLRWTIGLENTVKNY